MPDCCTVASMNRPAVAAVVCALVALGAGMPPRAEGHSAPGELPGLQAGRHVATFTWPTVAMICPAGIAVEFADLGPEIHGHVGIQGCAVVLSASLTSPVEICTVYAHEVGHVVGWRDPFGAIHSPDSNHLMHYTGPQYPWIPCVEAVTPGAPTGQSKCGEARRYLRERWRVFGCQVVTVGRYGQRRALLDVEHRGDRRRGGVMTVWRRHEGDPLRARLTR
jgi:hypothetical protein